MLTPNVERWRDAGGFEQVDGRQLYVQRREGEGPLLLLLHGFPSSSYDWRELLALPGVRDRAALAFDFLGFGLSDKPADVEYTLAWQADAAEALVRRAGNPPVYVVAHDMGTSVATELFARELRGNGALDIRGALLFNGSILLDRASPTTGQKLLRSPLGRCSRGSPRSARSASSSGGSSPTRIRSRARRRTTSGRCSRTTAATASVTCSSTTWPSASATSSAGTAPSATGRASCR